MTAVSRPARNNTSARRNPSWASLVRTGAASLAGNCAAVSARRPGVAARLLSLPGVRRDGWFQ
jgi:hypothetical protein